MGGCLGSRLVTSIDHISNSDLVGHGGASAAKESCSRGGSFVGFMCVRARGTRIEIR